MQGKAPTEFAAIENILDFGTESLEAQDPSISLLANHCVVWVDLTRPWPSSEYVRNEHLRTSSVTMILISLLVEDGLIPGTFALLDNESRNAMEG